MILKVSDPLYQPPWVWAPAILTGSSFPPTHQPPSTVHRPPSSEPPANTSITHLEFSGKNLHLLHHPIDDSYSFAYSKVTFLSILVLLSPADALNLDRVCWLSPTFPTGYLTGQVFLILRPAKHKFLRRPTLIFGCDLFPRDHSADFLARRFDPRKC